MSTKITITQDIDGVVREAITTIKNPDITWMEITEHTFEMLRGLTYVLPETEDLMDAIEDTKDTFNN